MPYFAVYLLTPVLLGILLVGFECLYADNDLKTTIDVIVTVGDSNKMYSSVLNGGNSKEAT